ncbi:hypothetical protein N9H93_00440, partial [Rhizobiaceae bacterium]|nr:hypothetical protein [Rhizobiaceae bacterium]
RLEKLGVDATYDAALAVEGGMTNSSTVDVAVLREAVIARLAVDASHVRVRNIYVFQNEFRTRNELRELASNER